VLAAQTQVFGSYTGTVKTLQTKSGLPIYIFKGDKRGGPSTCFGQCAVEWPPVLVKDAPTAGPGVRKAYLGTVERPDGTLQVTYRGRPLYTWFGDKPGMAYCHDVDEFGGLWLLERPDGTTVARG
jgi:predicted lipoprotein with Yx(FWY)xxD motif